MKKLRDGQVGSVPRPVVGETLKLSQMRGFLGIQEDLLFPKVCKVFSSLSKPGRNSSSKFGYFQTLNTFVSFHWNLFRMRGCHRVLLAILRRLVPGCRMFAGKLGMPTDENAITSILIG
ncbi:hypothetical protein Y032_0012g1601 [Ancylostoma ceylanicum]|uniref:Uncharacterized protein n=1 Tax=Ancylostoma ceylanicum TaxID=53326 RepID=A0A016VBA7_9BILA|nr:hypothetical protein Y032_0012g1601 [Ancylostoma ceylanicum]